jgi:integrase
MSATARHLTLITPGQSKTGPVTVVTEAATPVETPEKKKGGRKTKAEARANPYTIFVEGKTQGYYIRYTHPLTRERVVRPLAPAPGHPATKHDGEAARLAATHWKEIDNQVSRVRLGLDPVLEIRMMPLAIAYQHWVATTTKKMGEAARADIIRHMKAWMRHTDMKDVHDVRMVNGPLLRGWAEKLLTATRNTKRTGYQDKPFTRGMVRAHLVTLKALFKWMVSHHGLNTANPVAESGITREYPKGGRGDGRYYTPQQMAAVLKVVDGWRYTRKTASNRLLAYVLAYTGARIGEIFGLRVRDFDFKTNRITFENSKRTPEEIAANLRQTRTTKLWLALRAVALGHIREHGLRPNDRLSPKLVPLSKQQKGTSGAPETDEARTGAYDWLKRVCARAKIPYLSGHHVFRHTVISARARMRTRVEVQGHPGIYTTVPVDLNEIRAEVGHRDNSKVTESVYKHAIEMPAVDLIELDWLAIAEALDRQNVEAEGKFYQEDSARATVVASAPEIAARMQQLSA